MVNEFAIGVCLNLIGSVLINLGTNIVKYAHLEKESSESASSRLNSPGHSGYGSGDSSGRSSPSKSSAASSDDDDGSGEEAADGANKDATADGTQRAFYFGWSFFGAGNALNFASFSFAPQSLLSALGSIQFVANVIFGATVLKTPVSKKILLSTLAIVGGNTMLVVASSKEDADFSAEDLLGLWEAVPFQIYIVCVVVGAFGFFVLYHHLLGHDIHDVLGTRFQQCIGTQQDNKRMRLNTDSSAYPVISMMNHDSVAQYEDEDGTAKTSRKTASSASARDRKSRSDYERQQSAISIDIHAPNDEDGAPTPTQEYLQKYGNDVNQRDQRDAADLTADADDVALHIDSEASPPTSQDTERSTRAPSGSERDLEDDSTSTGGTSGSGSGSSVNRSSSREQLISDRSDAFDERVGDSPIADHEPQHRTTKRRKKKSRILKISSPLSNANSYQQVDLSDESDENTFSPRQSLDKPTTSSSSISRKKSQRSHNRSRSPHRKAEAADRLHSRSGKPPPSTTVPNADATHRGRRLSQQSSANASTRRHKSGSGPDKALLERDVGMSSFAEAEEDDDRPLPPAFDPESLSRGGGGGSAQQPPAAGPPERSPMEKHSKLIPFAYAATSALIGCQSVMLAKSSSIIIRQTLRGQNEFKIFFTYVVFIAWGVTMVFWLYRMNNALRMFDGVFIIPTLQVLWIMMSVLGGGLYFQEFYDLEIQKYVIFVMGILIVLLGVYGLAPDPPALEDTDEATRADIVKRVDAAGRTSISRVGVYTLGHDEAYQSGYDSDSVASTIVSRSHRNRSAASHSDASSARGGGWGSSRSLFAADKAASLQKAASLRGQSYQGPSPVPPNSLRSNRGSMDSSARSASAQYPTRERRSNSKKQVHFGKSPKHSVSSSKAAASRRGSAQREGVPVLYATHGEQRRRQESTSTDGEHTAITFTSEDERDLAALKPVSKGSDVQHRRPPLVGAAAVGGGGGRPPPLARGLSASALLMESSAFTLSAASMRNDPAARKKAPSSTKSDTRAVSQRGVQQAYQPPQSPLDDASLFSGTRKVSIDSQSSVKTAPMSFSRGAMPRNDSQTSLFSARSKRSRSSEHSAATEPLSPGSRPFSPRSSMGSAAAASSPKSSKSPFASFSGKNILSSYRRSKTYARVDSDVTEPLVGVVDQDDDAYSYEAEGGRRRKRIFSSDDDVFTSTPMADPPEVSSRHSSIHIKTPSTTDDATLVATNSDAPPRKPASSSGGLVESSTSAPSSGDAEAEAADADLSTAASAVTDADADKPHNVDVDVTMHSRSSFFPLGDPSGVDDVVPARRE